MANKFWFSRKQRLQNRQGPAGVSAVFYQGSSWIDLQLNQLNRPCCVGSRNEPRSLHCAALRSR